MTSQDRTPESNVYAVYARAATGGPAAVEEQVRAARQAVGRRGGVDGRGITIKEYRDVDVSGVGEPGPALAALLDDAAAGEIDLVMVKDLARLSRSLERLAGIAASMERAGARIVTFQAGREARAADVAELAELAEALTPGKG